MDKKQDWTKIIDEMTREELTRFAIHAMAAASEALGHDKTSQEIFDYILDTPKRTNDMGVPS